MTIDIYPAFTFMSAAIVTRFTLFNLYRNPMTATRKQMRIQKPRAETVPGLTLESDQTGIQSQAHLTS